MGRLIFRISTYIITLISDKCKWKFKGGKQSPKRLAFPLLSLLGADAISAVRFCAVESAVHTFKGCFDIIAFHEFGHTDTTGDMSHS